MTEEHTITRTTGIFAVERDHVFFTALAILISATAFAGFSFDWLTRRVVHPVYWIGLVALLVVEISLLPQLNGAAVAWINQGPAAVGEHLSVLYAPHPTVEF